MARTLVATFPRLAAARVAEKVLLEHGFHQTAMHLAVLEGGGQSTQEASSGVRDLLSELFGTEHPEEAERRRREAGSAVLVVGVPEGADIGQVRDTLLRAGASEIDERI